MSQTQIVEINGLKMEVDLRHAKRVEEFRIGDPVKVLVISTGYGATAPEVHPGIIVDFEAFATLPTIVVAYMDTSYGGGLKLAHINSKTTDKYELVASSSDSMLALNKSHILDRMQREIDTKSAELRDLEQKRAYFIERFGIYFGEVATQPEGA